MLNEGSWKVSDVIYNHRYGESSTLSGLLNNILRRAADHRRKVQ